MVGIYKITSPSGKVYIGQSWDIKSRINHYKQHYRKNGQTKLEHSFDKYGRQNHKFEIIHELPKDIEQSVLNRYECLYMEAYKDCGIELMNLREGGYGAKHTEESKRKIGIANLGKPRHTKESKKKIGEAASKRVRDIEWRRKQSIAHSGTKILSKDHIKAIRKSRGRSVIQYSLDNKPIQEWECLSDAQKELKCFHIVDVCQEKRKQCGGYIWRYKNNKHA